MTIQEERVRQQLTRLSGESCEGESSRPELCRALCAQVTQAVAAALAQAPEEAAPLGEQWAGALAWARLILVDEAAGPASVSADGVTVREGERSAKALALAERYRRALVPYLGEEGFSFVGT